MQCTSDAAASTTLLILLKAHQAVSGQHVFTYSLRKHVKKSTAVYGVSLLLNMTKSLRGLQVLAEVVQTGPHAAMELRYTTRDGCTASILLEFAAAETSKGDALAVLHAMWCASPNHSNILALTHHLQTTAGALRIDHSLRRLLAFVVITAIRTISPHRLPP